MSDIGPQRGSDLLIVPISDPSPASVGRLAPVDQPWRQDRSGRLAVVAMVGALLFLLVVALLWWASDLEGERSEAVLGDGVSQAAPIVPPPAAPDAPATSPLPLSPVPLPTSTDAPQVAVAPPVPVPAPETPTEAASDVVLLGASTTAATTTTVPGATVAPTSTVARTAAVPTTPAPLGITPSTTVTPSPSSAPSTTLVHETTIAPTTSVPTSTLAPTTTSAPAPTTVVPAPAVPDQTLLAAIEARPDLSRLGELIEMSGVAAELSVEGPRTLFAPNNTAFEDFAATEGGAAVLVDPTAVRSLLLRHLTHGDYDETTLFTVEQVETLMGEMLIVDAGRHTIDGADVLDHASAVNGQLHVVSAVLVSDVPAA